MVGFACSRWFSAGSFVWVGLVHLGWLVCVGYWFVEWVSSTIGFSLPLMGIYQSHALKRKRLNYFVWNEQAGGVGERAISSSIYFMFMLLWLLSYTYPHSLFLPLSFVSFSSLFLSFPDRGVE